MGLFGGGSGGFSFGGGGLDPYDTQNVQGGIIFNPGPDTGEHVFQYNPNSLLGGLDNLIPRNSQNLDDPRNQQIADILRNQGGSYTGSQQTFLGANPQDAEALADARKRLGESGVYTMNSDLFNTPGADARSAANYANANVYGNFAMNSLNGPSLAQEQLKQGLEKVQKGNFAQAISSRGTNKSLATRNAINANADAGANVAGQAALLRASEESQKRDFAAKQAAVYMSQGFTEQQASLAAQRDLEKYLAQRAVQLRGIESGVQVAANQADAAQNAAIAQGAATLGAAALSAFSGGK